MVRSSRRPKSNVLNMDSNAFWRNFFKKGAVLDPVDRISEVLYGLIMVLTFTGAISVSTSTPNDVRQLLWAGISCNLAWGLVDAMMNLMSTLMERGHSLRVFQSLQKLKSDAEISKVISEENSPLLQEIMTPAEALELGKRLKKLPEPPKSGLITSQDVVSFLQIFALVFFCTLPVVVPFAFFHDLHTAMRVSNGIALAMLFGGGYMLAGYAGFKRFPTALGYTAVGLCLVAITMAMGG